MGSLYGYEISSEIPLRRLLSAPGPRGRIELRRAPAPLGGEGTVVHSLVDAASSFTLTRVGERLHVDCSASGEFLVDGTTLLAAPAACDPDLWEHRVVTTAIPLVIAELGAPMLHGAAFVADGRAVVLAGTTGRGKSTAALAAGEAGLPLLAEDGVALEGSTVWPGPLGIRLAGDGSGKQTVFLPAAAHAHEPVPLGAIVVLGERGPALTVEPVAPSSAVPLVLPHLIYGGSDRLPTAFAQCTALVARARVYRCSLPDGLDRLPAALGELLSRVAAPARG